MNSIDTLTQMQDSLGLSPELIREIADVEAALIGGGSVVINNG